MECVQNETRPQAWPARTEQNEGLSSCGWIHRSE